MAYKNFEELPIWKEARVFCKEIWEISSHVPFSKDFSLCDQIRRSSGSVMDNIAEGFERQGNAEFIHFLYISKGSAGESRSQLYRALDRQHINQEQFDELASKAENLSKGINKFIDYLAKSDYKGYKKIR